MTSKEHKEIRSAYLFILPLLLGLSLFYFFAFFQNCAYSFTDLSSFGKPNYIGLENYRKLFSDEKFIISLKNTFMYVILGVPLVLVLSTLTAVFLNSINRFKTLFRTSLFLPAVTMPAAIGLLWRWLYNYEFGIINFILEKCGLEKIAWLSNTNLVKISITIVLVWSMVAIYTIIIMAGLQNISKTYYEAAKIDGASPIKIFFKITLPLLTPTLFFSTVMTTIGIFQIFDFIFLMIQPTALSLRYSMSLVYYFYDRAFIAFDKGFAAAISMVLFFIILIVTIIQLKFQKKWVYYE